MKLEDPRSTRPLRARLGAWLAAALLAAAPAGADTLYLLVDGVAGNAPPEQPLGKGAFELMTFSLGVNEVDPGTVPGPATKAGAIADLRFDAPVSVATGPLFQLAAQGKVIPKASMVAVDELTGKTRYRVDIEQVVVRSLGMQTLGSRDAINATLGFQRIRIRFGEGKDAVTSSWDRAKNAPWK
jgi:hypothetical protein